MTSWTPPRPTTPWSIFDGTQWTIQDQSVSRNYVETTFLMLSGGTMTGGINAININMSGNLNILTSSLYIGTILVTSTAT